jgi:hypothetical protein
LLALATLTHPDPIWLVSSPTGPIYPWGEPFPPNPYLSKQKGVLWIAWSR